MDSNHRLHGLFHGDYLEGPMTSAASPLATEVTAQIDINGWTAEASNPRPFDSRIGFRGDTLVPFSEVSQTASRQT